MALTQIKNQFFPGLNSTDQEQTELVAQMRDVAATCFDEIPEYQVLSGQKKELDRAIIALAYDKKGKLLGFCSALILDVPGVGDIFHTGLTCVRPESRGLRLTHKLTSKLLLGYLINYSPLKPVWMTNCACVLSSIGNVAKYFDEVYPSPYYFGRPSETHLKIGRAISELYREPIAINDIARFDEEKFIFENSVTGSVFTKDAHDKRFHHREKELTEYYLNILNFERGDEVLQVGKVSLMTFPRYAFKEVLRKVRKTRRMPAESVEAYAN